MKNRLSCLAKYYNILAQFLGSKSQRVKTAVFAILALFLVHISTGADQTSVNTKNPADDLPDHISRLTYFGQRADWSHDGRRILFIEKTFGDVYELTLETKVIRPVTHHYYHEGYTRALYLSNGDILLSGAKEFSSEDPFPSRNTKAELWVLDKSLTKPPVPLGELCAEGPAVSRAQLKIAWTVHHGNYPDSIPERVCEFWMADIVYENGKPKLTGKKNVLRAGIPSFPGMMETQNFRPPDDRELIFSYYKDYEESEVCGVDLKTGEVRNYSNLPETYEESEGIFPDGLYTTVERVTVSTNPVRDAPPLDLWKLRLDGNGGIERLTWISEVPGYRATNPVISDDGRFMVFQLAISKEQTGVGHGLFLYDLVAAQGQVGDN